MNPSTNITAGSGTSVTLTSTTNSTGAKRYKFFKNGQHIPGAGPGSTYTIYNAQVSDGATYTSTATIDNVESFHSAPTTLYVDRE